MNLSHISGIDKYSKEAKALVAKVAADTSVASDKDGQLVVDLVQTLNASHNDHSFDALSADSFMPVTGGFHEVMRDVNEHLAEITMTRPTFLSDLWKEIDGAIGGLACIDSCFKLRDTCCPFGEDFPVLWTFHYFLCSKETKRICYIACAAVNKARKASLVFYDDEVRHMCHGENVFAGHFSVPPHLVILPSSLRSLFFTGL
jgi:Maf1 regulator